MSLTPYEPFRHLENVRREMDRFWGIPWYGDIQGPRIDIYETEKEIVAHCEIPGVERKEDINIDIRDNLLEVRGAVKRAKEVREENYHRRERFQGSFHRAVTLPGPVIADASRASYRNGILQIVMPKAEPDTRRRNIEIEFH
jgi:HSP20 family protein